MMFTFEYFNFDKHKYSRDNINDGQKPDVTESVQAFSVFDALSKKKFLSISNNNYWYRLRNEKGQYYNFTNDLWQDSLN